MDGDRDRKEGRRPRKSRHTQEGQAGVVFFQNQSNYGRLSSSLMGGGGLASLLGETVSG